MSSGRYDFDDIVSNENNMYKKYLDRTRGLKFMTQFRTPKFKYPTEQQLREISYTTYTWGVGDRFYKLANQFYGDPEKWWIIAMFNQTPTEAFVKAGHTIYIPDDLDEVIGIYLDDDFTY
jgi:nucleoid-associated protein YgaU